MECPQAAQPPRLVRVREGDLPQGGQGFAGQGLMRGGGMMNTVNPTQSHAMELLQRQEVRSDLHLDVKQKAALDELMNSSQTDLQERMRKQFQSPELQDCVFTALNFFNDFPNTNLFNRAEQARVMNSEYAPVKGEPTLGDLVNLLNAEKEVFHSCVYIAEGFVFTKNGSNPSQPWILMKLADMLAMYDSLEKPKSVVYLRRKDFSMASTR